MKILATVIVALSVSALFGGSAGASEALALEAEAPRAAAAAPVTDLPAAPTAATAEPLYVARRSCKAKCQPGDDVESCSISCEKGEKASCGCLGQHGASCVCLSNE
ncbi:MAG: hypothetical protein IPI67_01390 [Myxococcales bacterium]|nr:hypothetical protein [Myxococcales bacterium]